MRGLLSASGHINGLHGPDGGSGNEKQGMMQETEWILSRARQLQAGDMGFCDR